MASMPVDPVEQQIAQRVRTLGEDQKRRVLEFITVLEQHRTYSARELLTLPPQERAVLVEAAFQAAQDEDFETFEAYSEEGLGAPGETR